LDIERGRFDFLKIAGTKDDRYTRAGSSDLLQVGTRAVVAGVLDGETRRLFANGALVQATDLTGEYVAASYPFQIGASVDA
jgi:hypothetical protein